MLQGLSVLSGGHIGGHIVLENVRYFTVKCYFRKIIFDKEKARKPLYIKDFRTFSWQGQKDLNPRHAVLETAALPTELYPYERPLLRTLCYYNECFWFCKEVF